MIVLLLSIQVLLSTGKPAKAAIIACQEVPAVNAENGDPEEGGDWAPTDSAGVMFFSGLANQTYHCTVRRREDSITINWSGELTFTKDRERKQVVLDVAQ